MFNKMCLLVVISLALVLSCLAQNSPQDYVDAHNAARANVGVGPMTWDDTIASSALNYAKSRNGNCTLVVSGRPYGENIASGNSSNFSGVDAVNLWVGQKQYYDPDSNTCAAGHGCGEYTQVVWRKSTSLGCARTPCSDGGWYVICNYYPIGNVAGETPQIWGAVTLCF